MNLDEMIEWDYGEGLAYYAYQSSKYYCVENRPVSDWFDFMELVLPCPFCAATIGAPDKEDVESVKDWMGKHLAKFHEIEVEKYLLGKEQSDEYTHVEGSAKPNRFPVY